MDIRDAMETDVPDMQAIYAHHVLHGTGTFEEEPPSVEEMSARFHKVVDRGYVWLVATDATGVPRPIAPVRLMPVRAWNAARRPDRH